MERTARVDGYVMRRIAQQLEGQFFWVSWAAEGEHGAPQKAPLTEAYVSRAAYEEAAWGAVCARARLAIQLLRLAGAIHVAGIHGSPISSQRNT